MLLLLNVGNLKLRGSCVLLRHNCHAKFRKNRQSDSKVRMGTCTDNTVILWAHFFRFWGTNAGWTEVQMWSCTDIPNIPYPYNSRTTTVLLAETLCRKWHPSPCSSELWERNSALACDLSPVTVTGEDSKSVYTSSWLRSRKKNAFTGTCFWYLERWICCVMMH